MVKVVQKTFKLSLKLSFFVILIGWLGLLAFYNNTIKFPTWYKPYPTHSPECFDASIVNKKFNPDLVKATIYKIQTAQGELKAWHLKALKSRKNWGAILVHGGGGDHNLLNPYAHLLSQYGWDSLSVDLPNHGCSYTNGKGIQYGKTESEHFDKFYELANTLFNTKALIATSMGVYVAAPYAFKNNWPVKMFFENPMISFQKIITDQKSYYIPPLFKSFFETQIIWLNKDFISQELFELKPQTHQNILLVYGTKDSLTPPHQAELLLKNWGSNTQLKLIEGARHAQIYQHAPGLTQKLVEDFIINN